MKKRKLAVMLTAALAISVLALSGCSQNIAPAQSTPPESSGSAQPQDGGQAPDLLAQIQEKGEIVVAMIDGSATVKTFYKERGRVRLQPENDAMEPIYADNPTILGKVVALMRRF